ncbi:MAG: DUF4372 domain-containing protein, partial [Bryobacteraceae bacterium]|nr:DUF4372 domain-containing protein [Bryobacteraceae bacterium]
MNRVCSIFSQVLQFIPRAEFAGAVRKHQAERHSRGFSYTNGSDAILPTRPGAVLAGDRRWTGCVR